MIAGRPTNLWLGFLTAATALVGLIAAGTGHPIDPGILGGVGIFEGAAILLVAYQPPTLNPGDTYNTATPKGQPNYVTTVSTPPATDAPPTPVTEAPKP